MKRILVTGSRSWPEPDTIWRALATWCAINGVRCEEVTVVHGDCPSGADQYAAGWARAWGAVSEPHPADWRIGKHAGPTRNNEMVRLGADVVLAFPLRCSPGTRHCMGAARRAGIPVINYDPSVREAPPQSTKENK